MAKKLPKNVTNAIKDINTELTKIYNSFGRTGDLARYIKEGLRKVSGLTMTPRTGKISTDSKNVAMPADQSIASAKRIVGDWSDIVNDAFSRLRSTYAEKAAKYKNIEDIYIRDLFDRVGAGEGDLLTKQETTIFNTLIKQQANASVFLRREVEQNFYDYYEEWVANAGATYDAAAEAQLDEIFRAGTKHVWSDIEYADAYRKLSNYVNTYLRN